MGDSQKEGRISNRKPDSSNEGAGGGGGPFSSSLARFRKQMRAASEELLLTAPTRQVVGLVVTILNSSLCSPFQHHHRGGDFLGHDSEESWISFDEFQRGIEGFFADNIAGQHQDSIDHSADEEQGED